MNATYWNIDDGQLQPGEVLDTGYTNKDDADRVAATLRGATVRRLKTRESNYPIEDSRYEPFRGARWCVIVRKR